ncbi:MAG: FtsX-like permease family protein [Gemmatimonadetes bacterium]|nr:FtsX-like permease family protein [Gemmatimonadota bacterium]
MMPGNQIAIALRHMGRYRGYTAINVLGLAVGMICAILIFLYVRFELSYDRYHDKADRIYRIALNDSARSPRELGPMLQADFPEIQHFARMLPTIGTWIMKHEDRIYYEKSVYWVNNELFDVFTFPLVRGDPDHALEAPYTVVISEDIARKYFGDEDPMGKTIIADNGYMLLTVTGVMENIPENAHFHADFLISLASAYDKFEWNRAAGIWFSTLFYNYIVLQEGHPPEETQRKLPGFVERHVDASYLEDLDRYELSLQPVTDIHLYSHLENEHGPNTEVTYLYILVAVGLFILVIASVNYVNLSTAQFVHRTREISMRKVLGASRGQLIRQCLGESVLMTTIAVLIALAAVYFIAPYFDALLGQPIASAHALHPLWWLTLPVIAILIGLLSGAYPALVFSSMRTIPGLKEGRPYLPGGAWSRKILVVFQFAISTALIIGTGILFSQLNFIQHKNLGFEKDQVIVIPTVEQVATNYQPWKDALLQHPRVEGVSQAITLPGLFGTVGRPSTGTMQRVEDPDHVRHAVHGFQASVDFVETMGMELLAGRSHRGAFRNDTEWEHIVINEAALRVLGWEGPEEAVGQQIRFASGYTHAVVGVVRDFHFRTLHQEIEPLVLFHGTGLHLVVRIRPEDIRSTLESIETAWSDFFPDFPFAFTFLDEDIDRQYRNEMRIGYFFGVFALVAVFLTGLGLVALVSFTAERRTREIGVRKALGASVRRLLGMLSAEFVVLVLVANVIAWPAAWLIMGRWLENFAYRVEMGWGIFFASAVAALLISVATIGYHVTRAALANPAEVLRSE